MAKQVYSELHFYALKGDNELSPSKNYAVDDIADFLSAAAATTASLYQFRFIKHQLEDSIRVDIDNISITDYSLSPIAQARNYNYMSARNYTEEEGVITYLDPSPVYYFITGKSFVAQKTATYQIEMDVLNTIKLGTDYSFNKKTYITREHQDRFYHEAGDAPTTYRRLIDYKSEGINPQKYVSDNQIIYKDGEDISWYLVIINTSPIDPDAVAIPLSNPVKAVVCSDVAKEYYSPYVPSIDIFDAPDKFMYLFKSLNPDLAIAISQANSKPLMLGFNDDVIAFAIQNVDTYAYNVFELIVDPNDSTKYKVKNTYYASSVRITDQLLNQIYYRRYQDLSSPYEPNLNIATILSLTTYSKLLQLHTYIGLNSKEVGGNYYFDRTNPQIIKIIKLPYAPINISNNKFPPFFEEEEISAGLYILKYVPEFGYPLSSYFTFTQSSSPLKDIIVDSLTINISNARDIKNESKLYSSEFFGKKLVYDSFSFDIDLEKVDETMAKSDLNSFLTAFYASGTTASKFMFELRGYITKKKLFNYNNVLPIARNNELPLYNIAYINYLKTGYNYDLKTKALQAKRDALGLGAQIGGLAMQTTLGAMTGGAAAATSLGMGIMGLASSITGMFYNQIQAQRNIDQKLTESANQGANINGSDDVDLMSIYTDNNKAKICTYEMSDGMKALIYDLLFYTGYVQNKYGIPNITSRTWFNFIQCEPVFNVSNPNVSDSLIEELKSKYRNGVTFFHMNKIASIKRWDIAQSKENWETSLL